MYPKVRKLVGDEVEATSVKLELTSELTQELQLPNELSVAASPTATQDELVVGSRFSSYEAFTAALKIYSNKVKAVYNVDDSKTVINANKTLDVPYPINLKYTTAKFVCKHYRLVRLVGIGVPADRKSIKIRCTSSISIKANKSTSELVVTSFVPEHNHKLSKETYKMCPEVRKLVGDEVEATNELELSSELTQELQLPNELSVAASPTATQDELVVGSRFSSYEAFTAALKIYSNKVKAVYNVDDSKTVINANKNLDVPYPINLKYTSAKFVCKHYGSLRSTGKGIRCNRKSCKSGCSSSISIKAIKSTSELVVTSIVPEHNHKLSKEKYKMYPEVRKLTEDEVKATSKLIKMKVKHSILIDVTRETTGKCVTSKDLANLRAQLRKLDNKEVTDSELLLDVLSRLKETDSAAEVFLSVGDATQEINMVYFQTGNMRSVLKEFPEILLMDTTNTINNMTLVVFMVEDGFGNSRVVAYCFVSSKENRTVQLAVKLFKKCNADQVDKILTAVVDKDYNEIAALKEILPNVQIQLSLFHVLKTFSLAVASKQPDDTQDASMQILEALALSSSEDAYKAKLIDFKAIASPDLWLYFEKKWHNCPEAWSCYKKALPTNLNNSTTNHLESSIGHIKDLLFCSSSISAAVQALLRLHSKKAHSHVYDNKMSPERKKRHRTSAEAIQMVIDSVKGGMSIRKACALYGVPRSTFNDKIKMKSPIGCNIGMKPILSKTEEDKIVHYVNEMTKGGVPLTMNDLCDFVQEIVLQDGKVTPFAEGRPGRSWKEGFLKRHPEIRQKVIYHVKRKASEISEQTGAPGGSPIKSIPFTLTRDEEMVIQDTVEVETSLHCEDSKDLILSTSASPPQLQCQRPSTSSRRPPSPCTPSTSSVSQPCALPPVATRTDEQNDCQPSTKKQTIVSGIKYANNLKEILRTLQDIKKLEKEKWETKKRWRKEDMEYRRKKLKLVEENNKSFINKKCKK